MHGVDPKMGTAPKFSHMERLANLDFHLRQWKLIMFAIILGRQVDVVSLGDFACPSYPGWAPVHRVQKSFIS